MNGTIRNPKTGLETPSLGLGSRSRVFPQPSQCPSPCRGPVSGEACSAHLITLTKSWKALSTLRGGSLALVSMYGIWKAKLTFGKSGTKVHKALLPKNANSQRSRGPGCF